MPLKENASIPASRNLSQKQKKQPLLLLRSNHSSRRAPPPPSATTAMLESMLLQPSKRKRKASKHDGTCTKKHTNRKRPRALGAASVSSCSSSSTNGIQTSSYTQTNTVPAAGLVWPSRLLADAPTVFANNKTAAAGGDKRRCSLNSTKTTKFMKANGTHDTCDVNSNDSSSSRNTTTTSEEKEGGGGDGASPAPQEQAATPPTTVKRSKTTRRTTTEIATTATSNTIMHTTTAVKKDAGVPLTLHIAGKARKKKRPLVGAVASDLKDTTACRSMPLPAAIPAPPPVATMQPSIQDGNRHPQDSTDKQESLPADPTRTLAPKEPFSSSSSSSNVKKNTRQTRKVNNDNFVRLNLRNSAGACRGARNKKSKWAKRSNKNPTDIESQGHHTDSTPTTRSTLVQSKSSSSRHPSNGGVDPLDDYVDGVLHRRRGQKDTHKESSSDETPPCCARHQRPCKLLKVKKASSNHRGRPFYVCSLPRGEQCDFFCWADDTVEAAQRALHRNHSYSGFVARQVAAHAERFRALTVPELRHEARQRQLSVGGKRQQLLARLSLWVRDELTRGNSVGEDDDIGKGDLSRTTREDSNMVERNEDSDASESDDDDDSTLSEELELYHAKSLDVDDADKDSRDDVEMHDEKDSMCSDDQEKTPIAPTLHGQLFDLFGYSSFREGQEWAIQRCLDFKRTLLVAPTGFGKSLCYALPASMMDGVCIVVSPLISLMQDQLRQLPPRILATTLSGSMSAAAMVSTIDDVLRNRIKILFVSPERLASPSFRRLFRYRWNPKTKTRERQFPTVSLLCVDEAHCISQWAHNFRPSYLRLRSLVGEIQPRSVLAMTATAGPRVVQDICRALHIPTGQEEVQTFESLGDDMVDETTAATSDVGIKVLKCDRDNIDVSSMMFQTEDERIRMLVKFLRKAATKQASQDEPNSFCEGCLSEGNTIVYVWRQRDAEVVAENLLSSGVEGGVVVYHGGMDNMARSKAQSKFMRGKARVCVATVAFGLGINKTDVAAVVHLYLPASPEHYLQEIGRAGRDGGAAKAVALILQDEIATRHSMAHSDLLSRSQVNKLLEIMKELVLASLEDRARQHAVNDASTAANLGPLAVTLPLESTVSSLDCKPETVETLLSLMEELDLDSPLIRIEGTLMDSATITLKRRKLERLAAIEPVAKCIMDCAECLDSPSNGQQDEEPQRTVQRAFLAYSFGSHRFSTLLGPDAGPRHVFAALRRLQNTGELELQLEHKALHLQVETRGIAMFQHSETRLKDLEEQISEKSGDNVRAAAKKALDAHNILLQVSQIKPMDSDDCSELSPSLRLFQELTAKYFAGEVIENRTPESEFIPSNAMNDETRNAIRIDVLSLLRDLPQAEQFQVSSLPLKQSVPCDYTELTLAKFLHALDTPRLPYASFRLHALHGKWRKIRFDVLLDAIHDILLESTTNSRR